MQIWWCEEHDSGHVKEYQDRCDWAWARLDGPKLPTMCRMVAMRLIPDVDDQVGIFSFAKRELEII